MRRNCKTSEGDSRGALCYLVEPPVSPSSCHTPKAGSVERQPSHNKCGGPYRPRDEFCWSDTRLLRCRIVLESLGLLGGVLGELRDPQDERGQSLVGLQNQVDLRVQLYKKTGFYTWVNESYTARLSHRAVPRATRKLGILLLQPS